jgi:MYXO-CTERM domain-containing protein
MKCGPNGCSGKNLVTPGNCSGVDNTCVAATITPCPNNLTCKNTMICNEACTTDAQCATGYVCESGACVPSSDAGVPDSGSDALVTADAPAPTLPAVPTVNGDFTRCTTDSECSTNHCVEGVCCDTACTDRCNSCALLTNPGKCTVEPIGVDLKNECGPALTCLGTCGGDGSCIGAGTGTMCARNRCVGASTGAGPAYCASPGAKCNTSEAVPFDCGAYICEPAFGACRNTCASSLDCTNGFVCDVPSKTCVAVANADTNSTGDEGGGCGCTTPGTSRPAGLLAATILALGLVARRRRP